MSTIPIVSWNAVSLSNNIGSFGVGSMLSTPQSGEKSVVGSPNNYSPFFYITPTMEFLSVVKANDNKLLVEITDTGGTYDGVYTAIVESSSASMDQPLPTEDTDKKSSNTNVFNPTGFPDDRPNFFSATGLYAVTLIDATWNSAPPEGSLGNVSIYDGIMLPGHGYIIPNDTEIKQFNDTVAQLSESIENKQINLKVNTADAVSTTNWKTISFIAITLAVLAVLFLLVIVIKNQRLFCKSCD
ncbi:MAG: hypothetical protein JKX76_01455 [Colwellia sp.]|nr:hypothetical protein [Colwellia sp.]